MQIAGIGVIDHDEALWVLDKPAGMLSAPGRGPDKQDSLLTRMQSHDPGALQVHRLDQATSGLMLMARSPDIQRRLQAAFAQRATLKIYLAVVAGVPDVGDDWQWIDAPIALHWPDRPRHHVGPGGKASQTAWQVLACDPAAGRSLLALRPITGRSHQLRVQCAQRGLPIVGDQTYGDFPRNREFAREAGTRRLFLHAAETSFEYQWAGAPHAFAARAPVPPEFEQAL